MQGVGRLRFWQKVLAALVIVSLLPVGLTSLISIRGTRDELTNLSVTNIRQRSNSTAMAIDAYLQARLGDIVVVSKLPDVLRFAQNQGDPNLKLAARAALASAAARSPEYESIAVVEEGGTIVVASITSDEGTSVKFREYFITAMKGQTYVSDPSYSVITNRPALFFSAPIKDATGRVVAAARTRVNLAAVWDLVETDLGSVGTGSHGFLVDDYGIRLAVSETKGRREQAESLIYKPIAPIDAEIAKKLAADRRFGQKTAEQLIIDPLPTLRAALDALPKNANAVFAFGSGSAEERGVVTRLATKPWAYVLAVPLSTYTKAADDATLQALFALALGLLLSLLAAALLTRSLVRPLRALALKAYDVSIGNIELREARFDTRTGDDITREVASAFDRMLIALRFYALSEDAAGGGGEE